VPGGVRAPGDLSCYIEPRSDSTMDASETRPVTAVAAPTMATTTTTVATTTTVETTTTLVTTTSIATTVPQPRVAAVVDGDTLDLANGEQVRLIGIDAPERGACGYAEATQALEALVLDKAVGLASGAVDDRDRYGRLLRYVDVDGVDAGFALVQAGLAISRYDSRDGYGPHPREARYIAADTPAQTSRALRQTTRAPTTIATVPPAAPRQSCDPNYSGACVPIASDVDCAGGKGNGPAYVRGPVYVVGTDIYGLDGDGDGVGCE